MIYYYRSPVGVFWIVWRDESSEWWLGITAQQKSHLLGAYRSAQGAAAAVYRHMTGYKEWDQRPPDSSDPRSLAFWTTGPLPPEL